MWKHHCVIDRPFCVFFWCIALMLRALIIVQGVLSIVVVEDRIHKLYFSVGGVGLVVVEWFLALRNVCKKAHAVGIGVGLRLGSRYRSEKGGWSYLIASIITILLFHCK